MENEIIGGLKNALERGEDVERAKQTFVNAGYSAREVKVAADSLKSFSASEVAQIESPVKETPKEKKSLSLPPLKKQKTKNRKTSLVVLLIIAIIIFAVSLGYLIIKLTE